MPLGKEAWIDYRARLPFCKGVALRLPLPGLSLRETDILRKLVAWHSECQYTLRIAKMQGRALGAEPLTTKLCSERLKLTQGQMLKVLNHFQSIGYVRKRRRKSAGPTGYGWDGSLHSEVQVSPKAAEELATHEAAMKQLLARKASASA